MRNKDTILLENAYEKILKKTHKILSEEDSSYVVQKGDSFYSISKKTGVSWEELKKANNIKDPNTEVFVGRELYIPSKNGSSLEGSDKLNKFIDSLPKDFSDDDVKEAPVGYNQDGYMVLQPTDNLPLSHRKPSPEGQGTYELKDSEEEEDSKKQTNSGVVKPTEVE